MQQANSVASKDFPIDIYSTTSYLAGKDREVLPGLTNPILDCQ